MRILMAALCVSLLVPLIAAGQTGDPQAGKAYWEGNGSLCRNCHGAMGEGGFGPDLAGRRMSLSHFARAVRQPWSIMPAFPAAVVTDKELADTVAYFDSLPPVAQPGPWRVVVPPGAPKGQELHIATVGCAQCHGDVLPNMRNGVGAVNGDFEWFKGLVYNHVTEQPNQFARLEVANPNRIRMGNYSPTRVTEPMLRELWSFVQELGPRAPVVARLGAGVAGGNGVTYTLDLTNNGMPGRGLTAEEMTVLLVVPAGATVVNTSGAGYQGVRMDAEAKGNVAVWQLAKLAPREEQTLRLTLSKPGTAQDNVRGFVRWMKPAVKPGPHDQIVIAPAPMAPQTN